MSVSGVGTRGDGKALRRKPVGDREDVASIRLVVARIKRALYFGLQGRNLQQTQEHLFVLEEIERARASSSSYAEKEVRGWILPRVWEWRASQTLR